MSTCIMTDGGTRPYHHGNLKAALLDVAVARARTSGPAAVTIRDVAHDVGVSPSAAYRHVRSREHLLALVAQVARQELAISMAAAVAEVESTDQPQSDAVARFRACGEGYIRFATRSGPLFTTAFLSTDIAPDDPDDPDPAAALASSIDGLISAGLLAPDRRTESSLIAWSAVHGLSCLIADNALGVPLGVDADRAITVVLDGVGQSLFVDGG